MATEIRRRRGTTVEHSTFTGAVGELTVDTTKKTVVVHDGITTGGYPLALESAVTAISPGVCKKPASVGGTVDAITATFSPAFASLAAAEGYVLAIPLSGANTSTTPTLAIDGLIAKTIVKGSNTALLAGDIPGGDFVGLFVHDASIDKYQLLNPTPTYAKVNTTLNALTPLALTFGATVDWDWATPSADLTLTGTASLNLPSNATNNMQAKLRVIQDATGGRSFDLNASYKNADIASPKSTGPNQIDEYIFECLPSGDITLVSFVPGIEA